MCRGVELQDSYLPAKPILSMCEELRCYIMRRMAKTQAGFRNSEGKIAPAQQKRLENIKIASNVWTPTWTGNLVQDMYEVSGRGEKVGVNLTNHTCACNFWQLTGLPCEHAIAAKNTGERTQPKWRKKVQPS
ncbi:hypothetical protein K1719_004380 [Acacia pycnantha]|nr:hypothetical protein K1719_004380 [Acacia pycnantha]